MTRLGLAIVALAAFAIATIQPAHACSRVNGKLVCGDSSTPVHLNGNPIIVNRPILSGNSGPVIIDGGVTIVGSTVVTGTQTMGTGKMDLLDAGSGMFQANVQIGGKVPVLRTDILDAGLIYAQGTGPIVRILPFTTAAIDFASGTIVCVDSAGTTVTGARTADPCFVGMPSTLTAGGTGLHHSYTCYVSAADTIKIRACAAGTADDPGSVTFTGYVMSFVQ